MRHKVYRIAPLKCRDLAAQLEFEIVWDYAGKPPGSGGSGSAAPSSGSLSIAELPSTSLLSSAKVQHQRQQRYPDTASSVSSRRTTASMSSQNSDRDPLADLVGGCSDCRSSKRRLERKEMQILQLESFLKESQKRIDSLVFENEELLVRETAETANAGRYRAITSRLLQELEMAFQFCATQVRQAQETGLTTSGVGAEAEAEPTAASSFMFLPQFEFMDRVKRFHQELDALAGMDADDPALASGVVSAEEAWRIFDFRREMTAALARNQQLQRQLEFVGRSLLYDAAAPNKGGTKATPPRLHRTGTNTSADTSGAESDNSLNDADDDDDDVFGRSRGAPVLTMTEQINVLERENFLLKAKLESALADVKLFHQGVTTTSVSASDAASQALSDDMHAELEQVQDAKARLEREKTALERELSTARAETEKLQRRLDASAGGTGLPPPPAYPSETQSLTGSSGGESDANPASAAPAAAPGFLNKIYMDVGKAKIALEEKVKQLNALLREATEENLRLQAQAEAQAEQLAATEPKIVELSDDDDARERVTALETQTQTLRTALATATTQLTANERELATLGQSKQAAEQELAAVRSTLVKAQERTAALEAQVQQLKTATADKVALSSSSSSSAAVASSGGDRSDELAEVQKQLKLSKQEVMQLRYRSNQMESVNERLEEALKEKRTLEVKLTALEGQLYDHRSRTISDNSFATDMNAATVAQLQKQLDHRAAQLDIAQREHEMLKRELQTQHQHRPAASASAVAVASSDSADLDDVSAKVKRFEAEITRLCDRNDEQAKRLEALSERVALVTRERAELESICREMMVEMDAMAGSIGASDRVEEVAEVEAEQEEDKTTASAPVGAVYPPLASSSKVSDRYESAVAPTADRSATSSTRGGGGGKVAHLIKNFSSDDASDASASTPVRRISKTDFRLRNGSTGSTGSSVEAMAARFQAGLAN